MSARVRRLVTFAKDESGAAASVEFVLIVAFIVAPLGMLAFVSKQVTANYFARIADWIASPFP